MEFYATLGDPCAKREVLEKLFRAGMTGIRVNLSHTSLAKCAPILEELYWPAARAAGRPDGAAGGGAAPDPPPAGGR